MTQDSLQILSRHFDTIVAGSGLAGLYAALYAARMGRRVALLTKSTLEESNSYWAQGGIAAVMDPEDSTIFHFEDTIKAGRGLCNPEAVRILVEEGPERVKDLIDLGMKFDVGKHGLDLALEGGHSKRRILHAGGSSTGKLMVDFLIGSVRSRSDITILEYTTVYELVSDGESCYGVLAYNEREDSYTLLIGDSTILAMGGAASVYFRTTNPPGTTGDGIAMAYEAGAKITDMEFVQFHPTALFIDGAESFLITEAVRGEGGYLINSSGRRFMPDYDERAELAPRDVVSRAIYIEMKRSGEKCVYLTLAHLDAHFIKKRFPNIDSKCREYGIDITKDPIPVAPAAHYTIGGVKSGLLGETNLKGLFVCGEVSATGVHGANRLASNSLLECIVFAKRAAQGALSSSVRHTRPVGLLKTKPMRLNGYTDEETQNYYKIKNNIAHLMDLNVGIVKNAPGIEAALDELDRASKIAENFRGYYAFKLKNLIEVCKLISKASLMRTESRGAHIREDYPNEDPAWKAHIIMEKGKEPRIEKC
ncbi:MAG: L-aspartate oxidase [Candidatus Methanosuratincola sp.]